MKIEGLKIKDEGMRSGGLSNDENNTLLFTILRLTNSPIHHMSKNKIREHIFYLAVIALSLQLVK
jgi:hypothetical protein